MPLPRIALLAAVALLSVLAPVATASEAEDKARQAFEALYGEDVKRATETRDPADDVALAAKLLEAAQSAEAQPELLAILAAKACELGARDAKGYDTALAAAGLVAEKAPDLAGPCQDQIIALHQRRYATARGDEKTQVGEDLVDALVASAAAKSRAGDDEEAGARLRKAVGVARAIKSAKVDVVESHLRTMAARQKARAQAEGLRAQVEADPANAKARDQLVRVLVVDLDRPAEAAKYLDETIDGALRKYVPAAAKPVAEAPEMACLELADWYLQLASAAGPAGKAAMFTRTVAYAERFLGLHEAADLDRTRIELALKKAREELEKLGGAAPRKLDVVLVAGGKVPSDNAALARAMEAPDLHIALSLQTAGGETFESIDGWKYGVIVLYNCAQKMTERQQANFLALMDKGVGLVVLHHGVMAYTTWPEFPRITGAAAKVEGSRMGVRYKVHVADPRHPITRGIQDYEITDETFSGLWPDPMNHILLATNEPLSTKVIGWTRTYRNAKVCYLQQGHDSTAYSNPVFKTLVQRAIRWVGGRL